VPNELMNFDSLMACSVLGGAPRVASAGRFRVLQEAGQPLPRSDDAIRRALPWNKRHTYRVRGRPAVENRPHSPSRYPGCGCGAPTGSGRVPVQRPRRPYRIGAGYPKSGREPYRIGAGTRSAAAEPLPDRDGYPKSGCGDPTCPGRERPPFPPARAIHARDREHPSGRFLQARADPARVFFRTVVPCRRLRSAQKGTRAPLNDRVTAGRRSSGMPSPRYTSDPSL